MIEEWRDIPGQVGYQVSSFGRVRSVDRTVMQVSRYGDLMERKLKGRVLSLGSCSNGYLQVTLGKENIHRVHRLVAAAFLDGDTMLQVNHKNGDRRDNRVSNLEWVTCSENHLHSYRHLPRKKHALTKTVRISKGDTTLVFGSALETAKYLDVTSGSVASAANKAHRCRGFEVSYV